MGKFKVGMKPKEESPKPDPVPETPVKQDPVPRERRVIHPGLDVFPMSYRCRKCFAHFDFLSDSGTEASCECGIWVLCADTVNVRLIRFSSGLYLPGDEGVRVP